MGKNNAKKFGLFIWQSELLNRNQIKYIKDTTQCYNYDDTNTTNYLLNKTK